MFAAWQYRSDPRERRKAKRQYVQTFRDGSHESGEWIDVQSRIESLNSTKDTRVRHFRGGYSHAAEELQVGWPQSLVAKIAKVIGEGVQTLKRISQTYLGQTRRKFEGRANAQIIKRVSVLDPSYFGSGFAKPR